MRCNATRPAAAVTADSCASLVPMVDTGNELFRAELQQAIWQHLLRTEGIRPEVEIREWSRFNEPSFPSPGSSYRGELFLSLRRLRDDANQLLKPCLSAHLTRADAATVQRKHRKAGSSGRPLAHSTAMLTSRKDASGLTSWRPLFEAKQISAVRGIAVSHDPCAVPPIRDCFPRRRAARRVARFVHGVLNSNGVHCRRFEA